MVRTRFAPSPTGHLHVGGARTALFSYYYAKKHHGQFLLRIEDTDFERSKKEYEEEILRSLKWLGVHWDEGPFFQSQRQDLYRKMATRLLERNLAYRCYLTAEELEKRRAEATEKGGHFKLRSPWRDRKPGPEVEGRPFALRFRYPDSGQTIVRDQILGEVKFENSEGDDLIILRSDGSPTYQLSVVVDDLDMRITHVIRGDDHLNNTPKQLLMIQALGGVAPIYAHCPMILGSDKAKLSKRHGAVSVHSYADLGYLPEALRCALIRLGWSYGDKEIFTDAELRDLFDLGGCGKSPSVFDVKKLDWVNSEFIKKMSLEEFAKALKEESHLDLSSWLGDEGARKLFQTLQHSVTKIRDAKPKLSWFTSEPEIDPDCREKVLKQADKAWIASVYNRLQDSWNPAGIMDLFKSVAEEHKVKMPQVAKAVRVLLTGTLQSPDMSVVLAALGKERVLARLGRTDFLNH